MSYLVLARKSRPQTFAEVVGQRSVVKTLQNSIRRNRVAHAILFSGVRGVGKTTLARLMAKAINCEGSTDTPPCDQCTSCREITAGSSLDLYEIDGASNRGIQEIRELKEKIRFLPTSSKYKIIIIDEVHMLTTEAFNALLKTLEEPPEHVHFMFATTELHKIPITILSRCQQYELKRIPAAELAAHFQKLTDAEGMAIDSGALSLIVREAEGSVRDGLSLLDQAFSFGEKQITVEDVTELLGLVDRDVLMRITHGLLSGDRSDTIQALADTFNFGIDIKRFSADLLECFRTLLLTKIEGCENLIDLPVEEIATFKDLAADYSAETIHQKLNLLLRTIEDIRYSSQPRLALETGFLKVIEAGNIVPVSTMLGRLEKILSGTEESLPSSPQVKKKKTTPEPQPSPDPVTKEEPPPPEEPGIAATPVKERPPQPEEIQTAPSDSPGQPESSTGNRPGKPVEIHPHEKDVRKHWLEFTDYVKDRKVWMAQDIHRADTVKQVRDELHLHYSDPVSCSVLRQTGNKRLLTEFVLDFFQKELTVRFILPEIEENGKDSDVESPQQKRQMLANDPLTIMAAEIFNGQVGDIRVGPRSR